MQLNNINMAQSSSAIGQNSQVFSPLVDEEGYEMVLTKSHKKKNERKTTEST